MADKQMLEAVREAIRTLLLDFAAHPFFDVREGDVQARLFNEIRERIEPKDVALTLRRCGHGVHRYPEVMRTSRVHRELKLSGRVKLDIAILKAEGSVELLVHENGALDILAPVREEDLAGLVEIKAAPSRNMWRAYRDDLLRLANVTNANPRCHGFFVTFDKSLRIGGSGSEVKPNFKWLDTLVEDPVGCMEAHWIDETGQARVRRGLVRA